MFAPENCTLLTPCTGAATSLKHAKPHELPSYPTVGIDTTSSGNTAANIATNNFKSFEHWKPGLSSSAGKAALLAHKDGGKVDLWTPSASDHGHTAAGAAMDKQSALSPRLDYGFTNEGRQRALKAATLSVTSRGRSGSTPTPPTQLYPDAHNAGHNALNAAAVAHKPVSRNSPLPTQMSSAANEAARLTHLNSSVNRNMFSEHPPIEVAAKQQKHHHALKGASLATQRQAQEAQTAEHPTNNATANARLYAGAGIQEQAQKLAQERLSKLDPDGVLAYREHYGYSKAQPRSRLSIRNRRARSSSGGTGRRRSKDDSDDDDATKAGRIRNQMSKFNEQVASVDSQKRKNDRNTLMAAAEKSVRQRMSTLDQQIFDETGKITPSVMEQWEAKARQRAAAESEKRLEHHGMVDLGGGRFMEQSEVEKIAASRMQPTLDEISATAEKQRARDEEVRLDQERRKEETAVQKQRDQDTKAEVKRAKQEEKEAQKSEKRMVKEEKRQGKAVKKEQDRKSEENDGGSTKTPKTSGENAESTGSFTAKATGSPAKPAPKKASSKLSKGERAAVEPSAEGKSSPYIEEKDDEARGHQEEMNADDKYQTLLVYLQTLTVNSLKAISPQKGAICMFHLRYHETQSNAVKANNHRLGRYRQPWAQCLNATPNATTGFEAGCRS